VDEKWSNKPLILLRIRQTFAQAFGIQPATIIANIHLPTSSWI
jgi:hypothetical protein